MITACGGKGSEKQSKIPSGLVRSHGDSIALAARFSGDFQHFLAVTDSLAEIGELSPIRADGYRGVAMQISEVYDSALVRQKRSESAELATIYDTQGKERQIAEQQAKNRFVSALSLALGAVVMLVLAFALYVFLQWRITKRRNRIMARQMTEVIEYKEKYRALKQAQQENQARQTLAAHRAEEPAKPAEPRAETAEPNNAAEPSKDAEPIAASPTDAEPNNVGASISISDGTAITDEQLFLFLRDLIENEQLFLQSDFSRQTLIERTGLSKDRIGAAFAQGSDSVSLPAYVRELRLDHAVRLMNDKPELTVEQVSMASGFTSADTFTRNFRAKFGMTPTTYKQTQNDA